MSLFKKNSSKDRETTEEMREILVAMQQERLRHEDVAERMNAAAERLRDVGEPLEKAGNDIDAAMRRVAELEEQINSIGTLALQIHEIDERAAGLARDQQRTETEIAGAIENAARIRTVFDELSQKVDLATELKDRLASFLDVEKPFQLMRGDADALRGQVEGAGEQMARLRDQHERLLDAHKLSLSKMEALDRRREELSRDMTDKERRVASVEHAVQGMDGVQHTVDDVKRDMGMLKALGEFVGQRSAALEAQREAVESALTRADQLDRAMKQIDAGIRQQQQNAQALASLDDQVGTLARDLPSPARGG
jgi:chromosome segregation ATPase